MKLKAQDSNTDIVRLKGILKSKVSIWIKRVLKKAVVLIKNEILTTFPWKNLPSG